ncbi:MAG: transglycosylase SLT domain-containing protein [Ottowia sp.]|nr:transglycosylase SLT domain-containing protein [Ottowia sp.]
MDIPACIAEAAASYQVAQTDIAAIIANGLPAGTVKDNRIGPMAIPTQWLPIFERMGISQQAIVQDACQNIIAGTWVLAYTAKYKDLQKQFYAFPQKIRVSKALQQRRQQWAATIEDVALKTGTPAALIHAVISVESGYKAAAVSSAGAIGMMQLMPKTAAMLGVNPWIEAENILGGAKYLAQLNKQFSGNWHLTLAAYNAGPAAVAKNGYRIPPFSETQAYVPKVLAMYAALLGK